ncbi:Protein CBR-MOAG-4 [Aphelenchoides besseyi]|nr:Protein CBR-MOAG-4 [Aphelenchoides besseyi]KAI6207535.1 Protein CBR-MOAG-4 [Aphelenchoides besseyi]
MTRGNQRELARAKNQKKLEQQNKSKSASEKNGGLTSEKRLQRDADVMREKQKKALEQKAQDAKPVDTNKVVKFDPLK